MKAVADPQSFCDLDNDRVRPLESLTCQSIISLKDFKLFSQYTNDFNGIDGHALFIGTVIHSLDHYLNEKHSEPLMFDVNCEKYGKMNEVLRFVRSSFVEKPPGILFRHMYKGIRDERTIRVSQNNSVESLSFIPCSKMPIILFMLKFMKKQQK